MNEALALHWREARRHEAAGDVAAAKAEYEALLSIEPMQVVPLLRLSRFAQLSDHYVEAHAHALEASRVARLAQITKDVGFVSLRLLSFAEDREVAALVQALDWSDVEVLKQAAVLAQHLWLVGQHEQAMQFLAYVGTRVRPNPLLSHTRANVLRSLGRLDEATEHYEYALELSPNDAHVHRSLAYHQPSRMPGTRIPRIKDAARHHPVDTLEQAHLRYALFKELDEMGETEGAWRALEEGAHIVLRKLRHDSSLESRRFEALLHASATQSMPATGAINDGPTPIFIVGMPRTGTTLLDRVLGNHPEVVSVGERNDFDAAVSEASDHFYSGGLHESQWTEVQAMDFEKVGKLYMERVLPLADNSLFFIDKNPKNFVNIHLILKALPHARILCLQRDAMDACFSNFKEMFEGGAYPYSYGLADLAAHHRGFETQLRYWQRIASGSVHVVQYEALVRDGDRTLDEILQFCGMQHTQDLLDITANLAPVSTASSSQVRQPMHDRSIGAWKRYATQLEPLRLLLEAARA